MIHQETRMRGEALSSQKHVVVRAWMNYNILARLSSQIPNSLFSIPQNSGTYTICIVLRARVDREHNTPLHRHRHIQAKNRAGKAPPATNSSSAAALVTGGHRRFWRSWFSSDQADPTIVFLVPPSTPCSNCDRCCSSPSYPTAASSPSYGNRTRRNIFRPI